VDLKPDAAGRIWLLFQTPILGDNNDLFIVQRLAGGKWGKPLFTGVWTEQKMVRTPPLTAYRGISISRLLAGDWIRVFPNDPALRRDTDGDGLTDQVETRLGTDPAKADTDGDGLPDLVDPCPNAAPRPRSDIEQIVAACVEARFFTEHMGIPAVLDVPGVKPFEFYANISTLIWAGSLRPMSLRGFFGGGVSYLGFTNPITQYPGAAEFVEFSPDHRTAQTIITRQSAGLSGDGTLVTLKKIDGEWFVVDMEGRWVS